MSRVELLTPSMLRWTTLSFAGKIEGKKGFFPKPSLPLAVERVDQRSGVGVSKFAAKQFEAVISKVMQSAKY